ncbi:MAG TPA: SDR family NAD(P)-dependent oxidoreductase [Baekduia sp.]|uniref:SDR family NAD(P)-dependent oxidoreductase n=1 Tax=Baekduia sp. TaxID=2600305 RepID=UPI002D769B3D|nr:SDR family NAD(P)-dependent oxidoreductase [Baekduia sp.]HET6505345.1 SDR family NAD(P)-dependent oxidoreductase [Baekduia sp.]
MPGTPAPPPPTARAVLLTGATRGIGRRLVRRFTERGDTVVAVGRDEAALAELARDFGPAVLTRRCEVTDEAQVAALVEGLDRVDVLVNNAGVSDSAPLHRTTVASWHQQMAVNALGPFLCTRAVIAPMRERGAGRIVTVASTAGRVGAPYTAAYTASKHAALGVMRVAAAELAGTGATANAVCPTFVDTPMTQRSIARIAERTGRSAAESEAALGATSPLGRLLSVDEVADAVLWLASDAAAAINGQALVLDGGGLQA